MSSLDALKSRLYDVNALRAAVSVMDWDQQTYMPKGGGAARAEQVGRLSRMAHETFVADETRTLLNRAVVEAEPGSDEEAMIRVTTRDLDLATKIPAELVEEKSRLATQALDAWVEARSRNDYASFMPFLEKMFEFARREADYLGYKEHIYDALIDQYEEGATAADCRAMFEAIKGPQVELVRAIKERGKPVDDSWLHGEWPKDRQSAVTEEMVRVIGFDFERGRQDTAPHPFCTNFSVGDVRLTTRFKPYLPSAIMGSMHEAGHGMYEQGSPMEWDRTPLAGGVSLGLHESQSRLWENIVGRSREFWHRFYPDLQRAFPQLGGHTVEEFYRAINKVEPSLIRVEADEVTYNLHVLVRFEVECDVLTGALAVKDIPDAWNSKYQEYLGITPPSDADGCLQDIHWSMGSIGYFPTYSMGNLLSYQIWNALKKDIPDANEQIGRGEFGQILGWLRKNIYAMGRKLKPRDLVQKVTGKAMDPQDYLSGLQAKYTEIYSL